MLDVLTCNHFVILHLGYLKQNRCDEVAEKFLNTSPHMKECLEMRNKRCKFMTKAHGLTLEEISNQCLKMNKMCEYLFEVNYCQHLGGL